MGHIAHLRKQFKSINTYDYIITLIMRRKQNIFNFMRINWIFIWRNLNPLHRRSFVPSLVDFWPCGSGVEDFWILSMYFCYFVIISPWKRAGALICSSPKDALCQVWLKLAQWFWRRRWKCKRFMTTPTTTTTKTTDKFWLEKLTQAFCSGELKLFVAKWNKNCHYFYDYNHAWLMVRISQSR